MFNGITEVNEYLFWSVFGAYSDEHFSVFVLHLHEEVSVVEESLLDQGLCVLGQLNESLHNGSVRESVLNDVVEMSIDWVESLLLKLLIN